MELREKPRSWTRDCKLPGPAFMGLDAAYTAVYMDFQGEIPLPVLVGWLSGGETKLTATVRRLALTLWEELPEQPPQGVRQGGLGQQPQGGAGEQKDEPVLHQLHR